jgi:hypothetical protein
MNVAPIRKVGSRIVAIAIAAIGMATLVFPAGCMMRVPMHESKVEKQVPARIAGIVPGQTDRAAVRAQLGEPWLSSNYWQFDLYHLTGRSTSVPVMWIFYWPVPIGVAVDESTTYVLEAYDGHGLVTANAIGVARDPSFFEATDNEPSTSGDLPGRAGMAQVEAGDVAFVTTQGEGDAQLTVSALKRDEYILRHPPASDCRLIVGRGDGDCDFDLRIDNGPTIPAPHDSYYRSVASMQVKPGTHRLHVASSRARDALEATQELSCVAAETMYVIVDTKMTGNGTLRTQWGASFAVSRELPEALQDARLVIWSRGAWLVPQEPGGQ